MFVDRVRVNVQAGDGGDGLTSFRREKFIDKGGPDGGDGGKGGDVVLQASRNQNTLAAFRYKKLLKAASGTSGGRHRRRGKSGQDLLVSVPIGTTVINDEGAVMVDLISDGQKATIARGGSGGFGNAHFASSTRQAPRISEKGEAGERLELNLELKMIADIGLVGLPNAGKSTLLSVLSNARPAIADYPFTTLVPNLGVVDIDRESSFLMADIPGLIEGASEGKGLGDEFLRHVERTGVLVHLIDVYSQDISKDYQTIMQELKKYKVDLSRRPQIVALTKTEGLNRKIVHQKIQTLKKGAGQNTPILAISALSGQGLPELIKQIQDSLIKAAKARSRSQKVLPVIRPTNLEDFWQVAKKGQTFVVSGQKIERFAARTRFGDYHAEQRLRDILSKMGIMQELEKQGIEDEQTIQIGTPAIGKIEY